MRAYASFIVRHRLAVLLLSLALTLGLGLQLRNLSVIVDADELLPKDHPFVEVTERVQDVFGNRFTVVVGITPRTGDVYTPEVLGKVLTATERLAATPGVTRGNIQSLAAPRAKDIAGDAEGLRVSRLLDHVPASLAEAQAVKAAACRQSRLSQRAGQRGWPHRRHLCRVPEGPQGLWPCHASRWTPPSPRSATTACASPCRASRCSLATLETFSKRMAWLLPIAILLIGLIHFEAFRTLQGLILPLVTAILALVWSLGLMTLAGVHLDPFNNVTPILILAVAAGHAVQMLKRYYEEYRPAATREPTTDARHASREAIIDTWSASAR